MRHPFSSVLLMLIAIPAAGADLVDIKWSGDGRFTHDGVIAAGKFVEVCGKLPSGLKVRWEFEASTPLDFNIHYHQAKDVIFPAKLSAVAIAGDTLATTIDQDYCWMWENKSATAAKVSVRLWR